jgi:hypothetical protein
MSDLDIALAPKSDQLNADDLIGRDLTITINSVTVRTSGVQKIDIYYDGDGGKPYKPSLGMGRLLRQIYGNEDKWVGKTIRLFRDKEVTLAGLKVGGIRISHMSGIEAPVTIALTATRNIKKPYTVLPLIIDPVVKSAVDLEAIKSKAAEACLKGSDVMQEYWNSLSKEEKLALKPFMDGYKEQAEMADEINNPIIGV